MKKNAYRMACPAFICSVILSCAALAQSQTNSGDYQVYVSNEKSGDITVISGGDFKVIATIPAGKRPRGIHASPDGKIVYVALSGTPIEPPPQLDANGNPILHKNQTADDDDATDKAADGLGIVDAVQKKFLRKISVGSDPEQFAISKDGKR